MMGLVVVSASLDLPPHPGGEYAAECVANLKRIVAVVMKLPHEPVAVRVGISSHLMLIVGGSRSN